MAEFMFPNVAYRATVYRTGVSVVLYLEYFKGDIFYLSCVGLWVTGQMREETIFGQMCFLFELFINSQIGKVLDIGGHFGQSLL